MKIIVPKITPARWSAVVPLARLNRKISTQPRQLIKRNALIVAPAHNSVVYFKNKIYDGKSKNIFKGAQNGS